MHEESLHHTAIEGTTFVVFFAVWKRVSSLRDAHRAVHGAIYILHGIKRRNEVRCNSLLCGCNKILSWKSSLRSDPQQLCKRVTLCCHTVSDFIVSFQHAGNGQSTRAVVPSSSLMYSVPVIVSRAHMEPLPHNIFLQFWFLGLWISSMNCNGTRPSKTDASCSSAVSRAYSYSPNFLLFPQERSFIFNKSYPVD